MHVAANGKKALKVNLISNFQYLYYVAYVMADAGYDVWILNHRGNYYSRLNLYMNPNDPTSGFWDFSFEDIGLKDYPPAFDYIREVTRQLKLYVIGHSMGTSAMLTLLG